MYLDVHRLTESSFPRNEQYGLTAQVRRAAFSVAANIVEGYARVHRRERVHFLQIALASLSEVGYRLHVAKRLGYISEQTHSVMELKAQQVGAPLSGLLRHEKGANYSAT